MFIRLIFPEVRLTKARLAAKYASFGHHTQTLSKSQLVSYRKACVKSIPMYESVANARTQGLLFCFCATALCTCLGQNVHPHSLVLHFRNPRLSRNCNYPYVDRRSVVDIYYVSSGFHMFSHEEYLGHGRSRNMWDQWVLDIITPLPWILKDFAILIAPLPSVWKLQMPIRQKMALIRLLLIRFL